MAKQSKLERPYQQSQETGRVGIPSQLLRDKFVETKAYYQVLHRFNCNAKECWLLLCLAGCLMQYKAKNPIVSEKVFLESLTGYYKSKGKYKGYLAGLERLKLVGRMHYKMSQPGPGSLYITELGFKVIECYQEEHIKLLDREWLYSNCGPLVVNEEPQFYSLTA